MPGDGFVYIADFDGAIWKGRNEQWTQITHGGMNHASSTWDGLMDVSGVPVIMASGYWK